MRQWEGDSIHEVLTSAVEHASEDNEATSFDFNGEQFEVAAGESFESAKSRWESQTGIPVLTREEMADRARQNLERMEHEYEEARAKAGAATEQEMREADVPWIEDPEKLSAYIAALVDRPHDYSTCVYAMSMAAAAAFRHVAKKLGVTGFQASCADMDILRRTRGMKDGFRIINYADLMYPQYWDEERAPIFRAVLAENPEPWPERARALLDEDTGSPKVREHWRMIAGYAAAPEHSS